MDPHALEPTNHDPSRIFGEPYETGGVTIIPVARTGRNHEMRPLGVYAVRDDQVTWHAAVDHERIALIGVATGFFAAVLGTIAVIRRPPWPDLRHEIR